MNLNVLLICIYVIKYKFLALCAMDENQLPYFKKTLVSAFDLVSSKADMKNDIGLASEYD